MVVCIRLIPICAETAVKGKMNINRIESIGTIPFDINPLIKKVNIENSNAKYEMNPRDNITHMVNFL